MFRHQYLLFGGDHIMFRHRYPIWALIHLIGTALWIALFIILVVVLMSWLCRKRMHMFQGHCHCRCRCHGHSYYRPPSPPSHLDALEILRQRYARGEIDDMTFQHMRERLGASTEPQPERPRDG